MATIKINGKEITVEDNTLILDAARKAGYEIPTFCYQADLMGIGSCRMCLVEIEGQRKLQPSCITPVLHGMSINTDSSTVASARAGVLEFLLANHALDCPVCDKGGECELQDMVHKYGPRTGRHAEPKFKFHEKDYVLSQVIIKNSNRCVQCMKCVRVCREVVGRNVLGALGRGDHQEPTSFNRTFLDCDMDGNCIEVCPVGCFMRLPYRYKSRPWDLKGADTICPYCATGCRMVIEERDGQLLRARAQLGVGLNSETLCARGRFGCDFVNSAERITKPLIRHQAATWAEALASVKDGFSGKEGKHIGGVAAATLTNEELYLFQKLMRTVFGSPNIDSSSRWNSDAASAFIHAASMNEGGVSIFDCMEADTVLIIGSHISDENPVSEYIVRRISSNRRMNLIIASPRAMKLDSSANVKLRHLPAAEKAVLDAITLVINAGKLSEAEKLKAIKDSKMVDLLTAAGVGVDEITDIAKRLSASQSVAIVAGTEFLRFPDGTSGLALLKDVLKNLGKKVTVMPTLDRCNQRGAWEMGVHPSFGPGYATAEKGMDTEALLEAAMRGEIDALYVVGEDIISDYPDREFARTALSKVRFLVVQDIFMSETAKLAHVILPGASFSEKEGMFTNQEGRAQSIRKLLALPGKAKRDLDIIRAVGELFDGSFGPKNAVLVLDEIRQVNPMYSDVSLLFNNKKNSDNRLDNRAALVKCAAGVLPAAGEFASKAVSSRMEEHSFALVTGSHLFHLGRFSRKSETLLGLIKGATVEICEDDAARLGFVSGEKVKVKGKNHEVLATLKTSTGSKSRVAFIPESFEDAEVNRFFRRGEGVPRVSITRANQ
ncbi:MAG: NADH-quinone oxidoreductase subunit NuoG [Deltaproteobacteria bacterium]|nr:NADH-quinone oxidoreductase subunit NuoG [Deltaproteobacteria bacterium]